MLEALNAKFGSRATSTQRSATAKDAQKKKDEFVLFAKAQLKSAMGLSTEHLKACERLLGAGGKSTLVAGLQAAAQVARHIK